MTSFHMHIYAMMNYFPHGRQLARLIQQKVREQAEREVDNYEEIRTVTHDARKYVSRREKVRMIKKEQTPQTQGQASASGDAGSTSGDVAFQGALAARPSALVSRLSGMREFKKTRAE